MYYIKRTTDTLYIGLDGLPRQHHLDRVLVATAPFNVIDYVLPRDACTGRITYLREGVAEEQCQRNGSAVIPIGLGRIVNPNTPFNLEANVLLKWQEAPPPYFRLDSGEHAIDPWEATVCFPATRQPAAVYAVAWESAADDAAIVPGSRKQIPLLPLEYGTTVAAMLTSRVVPPHRSIGLCWEWTDV